MAESIQARNGKFLTWDVMLGQQWYNEGVRISEIARRLGVRDSLVRNYAVRHWTPAALSGYKPRSATNKKEVTNDG